MDSNSTNGEPGHAPGSGIVLPPISYISGRDSNEEPSHAPVPLPHGVNNIISPSLPIETKVNTNQPVQASNSGSPEVIKSTPPVFGSQVKSDNAQEKPIAQETGHSAGSVDHQEGVIASQSTPPAQQQHLHQLAPIQTHQEMVNKPNSEVIQSQTQKNAHPPAESNNRENIKRESDHTGAISKVKKAKSKTFDKSKLDRILTEFFPTRHNLGTIMYNPTTTWATLQTERLIGLKPEHFQRFRELKQDFEEKLDDSNFVADVKYIPCIPALPTEYSNSLLEIKIPRHFIDTFLKEAKYATERKLWGGLGGIYTDDSDILSVLLHLGLFQDEADFSEWNSAWTGTSIIKPLDQSINIEDCDLSVTILLLPPLESYSGYYSNGVNSRSWSSGHQKHRGLSMVVYNAKWETSGTYLLDSNLVKWARKELMEDMKQVKEVMCGSSGWKFSKVYYDELREKYKKLEEEDKKKKNEEKEQTEQKQQ